MPGRSLPPSSRTGALPLVIGLGNDQRSDDRSGLEVARALRRPLAGRARVEEYSSEGIGLIELWRDSEHVLVIDAVRSGAAPGTVHRIEPADGALPHFHSATSTHGLSLTEAVAIAQGLGELPRHLVIYGIEAENLDLGSALSAPVARGVREATERILDELGAGRGEVDRESDHA